MKKPILFFLLSAVSIFPATYHADDVAAGTGNGSNWDNKIEFEGLMEGGSVAAGDTIYVKGRAYSLSSDFDPTAYDGSAISVITIIGVLEATTNTGESITYSDWARDSGDVPKIDCGANRFYTGDYYRIHNFYIKSSANITWTSGVGNVIENCWVFNTDAGTDRALYLDDFDIVENCYISGPRGIEFASLGCRAINCRIRNCIDAGIHVSSNYFTILNCQIDSCLRGINITTGDNGTVKGITFFECDTAVVATDAYMTVIMDYIIEGSDHVGIKWGTQTDINFFKSGHGDDARNNDMWSGVASGHPIGDVWITTGDPKFENPPDSLQLDADSPCLNTGSDVKQ